MTQITFMGTRALPSIASRLSPVSHPAKKTSEIAAHTELYYQRRFRRFHSNETELAATHRERDSYTLPVSRSCLFLAHVDTQNWSNAVCHSMIASARPGVVSAPNALPGFSVVYIVEQKHSITRFRCRRHLDCSIPQGRPTTSKIR